MPKVLRIINRLNLGGPTYNAVYLSKYMAPEFETLLLSGMRDDSEASSEYIAEEHGLTPIYIPDMYRSIHPYKDSKSFRKIVSVIREFKPDIVHTHAAKAGTVGRLAAFYCKVPVILHTFHGHIFHSYFSPAKTRVFLEIERFLARLSNKLIAISDLQKHELSEVFKVGKPDKFEVVPLGFNLDRFKQNQQEKRKSFRDQFQIEDDETVIGILGRLVPVKNHALFLQSMKQVLQNSDKKIKGVIVGDGEEMKNVLEIARSLELKISTPDSPDADAPIIFTSWIKEADYAIAGIDIMALTSNNEGTPVSLIEAQAAGKPIVSTKVGGIADIVIPGETAFLSEPGNFDAFAENLLKLINNKDLMDSFGEKGFKNSTDKFDYLSLVSNMTNIYNRLLIQK